MTNGCYMCQSLLMQLGSVATATLATDSRYGDIWVSPLFVCTVCITCNVCYLTPNFCGSLSPLSRVSVLCLHVHPVVRTHAYMQLMNAFRGKRKAR